MASLTMRIKAEARVKGPPRTRKQKVLYGKTQAQSAGLSSTYSG